MEEKGLFKNGRKFSMTHIWTLRNQKECAVTDKTKNVGGGFNIPAQCVITFQAAYTVSDVTSEEEKALSVCSLSYFCSGNSMLTVPLPCCLPEWSLKKQTLDLCVAESLASQLVDWGKFCHSSNPELSVPSARIAARDPGEVWKRLPIHRIRQSSLEVVCEKDRIAGLQREGGK